MKNKLISKHQAGKKLLKLLENKNIKVNGNGLTESINIKIEDETIAKIEDNKSKSLNNF